MAWSRIHPGRHGVTTVVGAGLMLGLLAVILTLPVSAPASAAPALAAAGGHTAGVWSPGATLPAGGAGDVPAMLSCGSPAFCVAFDQEAAGAWTYTGGNWSFDAHAGPGGGFGALTGLQCFADRTCVATDAQADLITYAAGRWSSRSGPTENGGGPMGCPSADLCLFVDGVGQSYTWDGRGFSRPQVAYPSLANTMGSGAVAIACATATKFCAVADELGDLGTYNAGHWGPLSDPYGSFPLGAGCASATGCIAAFRPAPGHPAPHGNWAVYNGYTWSRHPGGAAGFPSAASSLAGTLSCGAGFCADLQQHGPASGSGAVWQGGRWSTTGTFSDGGAQPQLLACAPSGWCVALYAPASGSAAGRTWVLKIG
jgi:hypothetical protein